MLAAAILSVAAFTGTSPALAGSGPGSDPQVAAAQQALNAAKAAEAQARNAEASANQQLVEAQAALSQAQAQLAGLQQEVASLDAEVASSQARVDQLDAQISQDKAQLQGFLRASYEVGGSQADITYVVDSRTISDFVERLNTVSHVAEAGKQLVARISTEESQAQRTLAETMVARQQAQAAQEQAKTEEVIVANDEATAQEVASQADYAAYQAHLAVNQAQSNLNQQIKQYQAEQAAAAAAAKAAAAGTVYQPVAGNQFTVDTNLTLPSGENAQALNAFLAGTALAGLGNSYMNAEKSFGVSALYLAAHSIEESGWGTSAIAQAKHNLFGFGADDSNPFEDAMSFPSFDACIQYVANFVKVNYLTPGGAFYHGPTLRGMNVDYASDPYWASKIAAIADTIPLPGG